MYSSASGSHKVSGKPGQAFIAAAKEDYALEITQPDSRLVSNVYFLTRLASFTVSPICHD